jgi:hypothetical protein
MRFGIVGAILLVMPTLARADLSGSWRAGFSNTPGGPVQDSCRFDFVEEADGSLRGYLGMCGLGTDGVFSGTVDASGALAIRIVAPDDIGCEVYGITGTVAPSGDAIDASFACNFPTALTGYVTLTRCDPLTPGSCPNIITGVSLPPRPHEVHACAPAPAASCHGSIGAHAKLAMTRADEFHYALTFKLPDSTAIGVADLGDPLTVRDYVACVYQTIGGAPVLVAMEPAWAATTCAGQPCWQLKSDGVAYKNPLAKRGKLTQMKIKVRTSGSSKTTVKGRATTVTAPPSGTALEPPVVVQLFAGDGACLGATFPTLLLNDGTSLKATHGE